MTEHFDLRARSAQVVGFVDVADSTAWRREHGIPGSEAITAVLQGVADRLCIGPVTRFPIAGDGFLFHGPAEAFVELLRSAVDYQRTVTALLPVRITFCVGLPTTTLDGDLAGTVIDRAARLKDVCPVGGIAMDGGAFALLSEQPRLRDVAVSHNAYLKGLGHETYWLIDGRSEDAMNEDPRAFGRLEGRLETLLNALEQDREERRELRLRLFGHDGTEGVIGQNTRRIGALERWRSYANGALAVIGAGLAFLSAWFVALVGGK